MTEKTNKMSNSNQSYKSFFEELGDHKISVNEFGCDESFTVEELYQAIKKRLDAENHAASNYKLYKDSARNILLKFGSDLIGKKIITPSIGNHKGGEGIIKEITPDKNAPEIVFTVFHPGIGEIGVFDNETVELVTA